MKVPQPAPAARPRSLVALALALLSLGLLLIFAVACTAQSAGPELTSTSAPLATSTEQPAATSTPTPLPAATPSPVPTLPDRTSCDEMRGTAYRSPAEREFFLASCITPVPVAQPVAAHVALPAIPQVAPPGGVTAIGDSVMLGAAAQLQAAIGGLDLFAQVSLQAAGGIEAVRQRKEANVLGSTVIIHVGNNGAFTAAEFGLLMSYLADARRVVVVNLSLPRSWEAPNNAMLAQNVGRYPNAVLVDWHAAGAAHPEYFWSDAVHLRPEGAYAYTALIASAI